MNSIPRCKAAGLIISTSLLLISGTAFGQSDQGQYASGVVFHDKNKNQIRDEGEPGIPNVRVSNQFEIVVTDSNGSWKLPSSEDITFFVIQPSGYRSPVDPDLQLPRFYYTHKPAGSPELKYGGVAPTGPLPESIDFPLYAVEEPETFRAVFFGDTQARDVKELHYMADDVIRELVGVDASFGVTLGDIVFDDLSIMDLHNRIVALIGIPWYNVIGNHDINYDAPNDRLSDETYERHYGPNYYSFDHGPAHFVVLDNINWIAPTASARGRYNGLFGEDQLNFVQEDLKHVDKDKLVLFMMHIPLTNTGDREDFYEIIKDHPYALSISGHTHYQEHVFLTDKDGWPGAKPHHHIINVTVCGSWWTGIPDERGIPHTTMRDGAPNGYSIMTFKNNQATWEFKAASRPQDYQMNIYAPRVVKSANSSDTEILVNVFGGSSKSLVEMRLGDSGPWTLMQLTETEDPAYAQMKEQEKQFGDQLPGRKLSGIIKSSHIWKANLSCNPEPGVHWLHVRAKDMYGKVYTDKREIEISQSQD